MKAAVPVRKVQFAEDNLDLRVVCLSFSNAQLNDILLQLGFPENSLGN